MGSSGCVLPRGTRTYYTEGVSIPRGLTSPKDCLQIVGQWRVRLNAKLSTLPLIDRSAAAWIEAIMRLSLHGEAPVLEKGVGSEMPERGELAAY